MEENNNIYLIFIFYFIPLSLKPLTFSALPYFPSVSSLCLKTQTGGGGGSSHKSICVGRGGILCGFFFGGRGVTEGTVLID